MKKAIHNLLLMTIFSMTGIQASQQQDVSLINFELPIQYKLFLDKAVAREDVDTIITLLTSGNFEHDDYRNNYPLAMKLYRILVDYSPGEDFTNEARYIPIKAITYVAKALAQEGGNKAFLTNLRNKS